MVKYINADVLKDKMFNYYDCVNRNTGKGNYKGETLMNYEVADMIEDCIDNAPTADVREVKHGRWVLDDGTDGWRCSECGHATNERILKWYQEINGDTCNICYQSAKPFYCSRCGAKMENVEGLDED